ncbi:LBP / BPI / CETP family protein [Necator americanus]|uniref:LBP / BPI / CETP family protein n=1 Tax=Necator americanus TaxID=51031 RepID=W2SY35_NECAM|nr:LBP / BPI / CETP family protein [Necator americanus]ETN73522.1 LBP / BPI / CETP family protein [Necator americanus]
MVTSKPSLNKLYFFLMSDYDFDDCLMKRQFIEDLFTHGLFNVLPSARVGMIVHEGVRGYPGIRARLNQRAFQYASGMLADVLNQEIKKARIPPITQCIPQVNGCVQIYNLYVSRYRCPQRVVLYPAPPNRIVLQVQNATITVELGIERGPYGPYLRILSCNVQIGYADAYIEHGGLIGDIINSQFRQRISSQVREMIPSQICGQLPSIVNERVNTRLAGLPQSIAVSQMLSMFGGALMGGLGGGAAPTPQYCQTQCRGNVPISPQLPGPQKTAALPPAPAPAPVPAPVSGGGAVAPQIPHAAYKEGPAVARGLTQRMYQTNQAVVARRGSTPLRPVVHAANPRYRAIPFQQGNEQRVILIPVARTKRQVAPLIYRVTNNEARPTAVARIVRGAPPPMIIPPPSNLCAQCPVSGGQEDPMSLLRQLFASLDMRKLNDLYLSLQLLNTQATSNDFTVDLTGEFSPNARGGTPFGAFPVMFPSYYDPHMAEFILSDYTINSLFYWLHRKQFLTFRIGPETPKIGELLKTTCNEEEVEELEPTDVELDEETRRRRALKSLKTHRTKRAVIVKGKRGKRQDDAGGLADLGICFGDILPAIREKYPNQKIAIVIRTARAPSAILSQAQGGMVTLDGVLDADIYIDGTNTRVGTLTIAATITVVLQMRGNRLTGTAEFKNLKMTDRTGSLGLPQDALDNLGNLGKELLQRVLNDALQKGIAINIPLSGLGGLPINIINPQIRIIEHGVYIATDLTISPSLLGIGGGQC